MTDQVKEKLMYEGVEFSMEQCPSFPENDPRIKQLNHHEINDPEGFIFSTACWRRYISTWEIKDNKFYLVDIIGIYKLIDDLPILADWFSGVIKVPGGDLLSLNVQMGFKLEYEKELHLKIDRGKVVESKIIDYRRQTL